MTHRLARFAWAALPATVLVACGAPRPALRTPRASVDAGPPAAAAYDCPRAPPKLDAPVDSASLEGLKVAHLCVIGVPDSLGAKVRGALSTKEGESLASARITGDLHAIFGLGFADDVDVFAQAAGRDVNVLYAIKARPLVESVSVEGATALGDDGLAKRFPLQRGSPFDPSLTQTAANVLVAEYSSRGYIHATAGFSTAPAAEGRVAVHVHVVEGVRLLVRSVDVTGLKVGKKKDVLAIFHTQAGSPYEPTVFQRDVMDATAYLYDRGVLDATLEPKIAEDGDKADVILRVIEGPVYRLGTISFAGESLGGSDKELLALMKTRPGAVFSRSALLADLDTLRTHARAKGIAVDVLPETELVPARATVNLVVRAAAP